MQTRETHFSSLSHALLRMLESDDGKKQIEKVKIARHQFMKEHSNEIRNRSDEPV
jgi:hypothetical protein